MRKKVLLVAAIFAVLATVGTMRFAAAFIRTAPLDEITLNAVSVNGPNGAMEVDGTFRSWYVGTNHYMITFYGGFGGSGWGGYGEIFAAQGATITTWSDTQTSGVEVASFTNRGNGLAFSLYGFGSYDVSITWDVVTTAGSWHVWIGASAQGSDMPGSDDGYLALYTPGPWQSPIGV